MAKGGNNRGPGQSGKPPTPTEQVILEELALVNGKLDKVLRYLRKARKIYPPASGD